MNARASSRLVGLLKKPEVQFFLISLIPLIAVFIVTRIYIPVEQQPFMDVVLLGMFGIITYQMIYSVYMHAKLAERERAFLSVSAHQMRSPLTAVKWILSEMGKNDNKPEERKDLARVGDVAVTKLNNIIDAFSAMARVDEGATEERMANIDMCEEIEKSVEAAEPVGKQYGVAVHFEGPCEELWVRANPVNLEMVFSNLINNAIKYNHRGGMVAVGARKVHGGSQIEVMVRDTGMGIPPNEQGRIFERYFRGAQAQRVNEAGSGLGLHLTKTIIEQHGGTIWLESIHGKGTTFHFTLPTTR